MGKRGQDWHDYAFIEQMQVRYNLIPYWVDAPEDEQQQKTAAFAKEIYPIFAKIEQHGFLKDIHPMKVLHEQDLAIFDSGYRINRLGQTAQVKAQKKSTLGQMFKEAMG